MVYLEYFKSLFAHLAQSIPLNSLFFSEDAHQIIADVVADIVRDSSIGDVFIPNIVGGDERLQKYLSQISIWGAGRCYNYAALALYHLLEEGVRPVDALWLNAPTSIGQTSQAGHQIIVIGLPLDNDYTNLAQSDALILDFWNGTIVPAHEYFQEGSPFHHFDSSVIQCCRIKDGEENPFKKPCLVESKNIMEFKQSTSTEIITIIKKEKNLEKIFLNLA